MTTDHTVHKRDILTDVLNGASEEKGLGLDDLDRIIYRNPSELKNIVHKPFKLTTQHSIQHVDELRRLLEEDDDDLEEHHSFRLTDITSKKTTVYFSRKIYTKLKSAKYHMKKLVPDELRSKISMSRIINNALIIVLHEFERKEENSVLLKQMVKVLQKT